MTQIKTKTIKTGINGHVIERTVLDAPPDYITQAGDIIGQVSADGRSWKESWVYPSGAGVPLGNDRHLIREAVATPIERCVLRADGLGIEFEGEVADILEGDYYIIVSSNGVSKNRWLFNRPPLLKGDLRNRLPMRGLRVRVIGTTDWREVKA